MKRILGLPSPLNARREMGGTGCSQQWAGSVVISPPGEPIVRFSRPFAARALSIVLCIRPGAA